MIIFLFSAGIIIRVRSRAPRTYPAQPRGRGIPWEATEFFTLRCLLKERVQTATRIRTFDTHKSTLGLEFVYDFPPNVCRPQVNTTENLYYGIVRPTAPRRQSASQFADAGIGRTPRSRRFQPSWSCWTALASSKNRFSVVFTCGLQTFGGKS